MLITDLHICIKEFPMYMYRPIGQWCPVRYCGFCTEEALCYHCERVVCLYSTASCPATNDTQTLGTANWKHVILHQLTGYY